MEGKGNIDNNMDVEEEDAIQTDSNKDADGEEDDQLEDADEDDQIKEGGDEMEVDKDRIGDDDSGMEAERDDENDKDFTTQVPKGPRRIKGWFQRQTERRARRLKDGNGKRRQEDTSSDGPESGDSSTLTPPPPPPNQLSLQPPIASFTIPPTPLDESLKEASGLFEPDAETLSGLTSDQGIQILAAVLALSQAERAALMGVSHEDLVSGFRAMISPKRRNVAYTSSPKHKRARR
jgi:hypothetical protein